TTVFRSPESPRREKPPPSQLAEEAASARDGIRVNPARQIAPATSRPDRPVLQPPFVLAAASSVSNPVKADLLVSGCVADLPATRYRQETPPGRGEGQDSDERRGCGDERPPVADEEEAADRVGARSPSGARED